MKKIIFLLIVTLSVIEGSFAQQDTGKYIRKGLIRSMATISPGIMLNGIMSNTSTIFIHGNLEYYVADNVSIRGDSYYFLQAKDNDGCNPFEYNHSTFSGASYHFKTKNHFDPYLTLEPGISITKRSAAFEEPKPCVLYGMSKTAANPLLSSAIGFNFYFQKLFHLFGEARYIIGKNISGDSEYPVGNSSARLSLNELRFSFGLGFNINVLKKK